MAGRIQLRRGTAANWTSANPTLAAGEVGLETDTGRAKVGNGSTAWASLSYVDAVGIAAHEADTTSVHGIADTSALYRAGGTDVAVVDGGTGASSASAARTNLGVDYATIAADSALTSQYMAKASGLATPATLLPKAVPSGNISWSATSYNFSPKAIGTDGLLYATYLNRQTLQTADGFASTSSGPDFTAQTPSVCVYITRTTAGYVAITNDTTTDVADIWFCATWSAIGSWTKVKTIKAVTSISIAEPVVVAGTTWMVVGEYKNVVNPSVVRKLWLSKDGGQTWTSIRDSLVTSTAVNSHWHHSVITKTGRIYASQGDGVNAWFGYTDDSGASWVPCPLSVSDPLYDGANIYIQPTQIVDLGEMIVVTPDRGASFTSGIWRMDPDIFGVTNQYPLPSGERCDQQYGSGSCRRGREAYVSFPDQGSGSAKTYIVATGDNGRTWQVVSTINTTGGTLTGNIVGPDLNGKVYMQPGSGSIPTYTTYVMVGTLPTWSWSRV